MPRRALDLNVRGRAELGRVIRQLHGAAETYDRRLHAAALDALDIVPPLVRGNVPRVVPKRYARVLGPALRFDKSGKLGKISLKVSAKGRRELRDVPQIDRGRLRHPLFGARKTWYDTRVKLGLVSTPFEKAEPMIVKRIAKVRAELIDELTKG